jgi:LuxR family transcriptional regulator, quorum-sensing system regulator SolR
MDWRGDSIDRLARSARSSDAVIKELALIVAELGFEYCSYVMKLPFPLAEPSIIWSSTYPERWLAHYFAHNYLNIDPLLIRVSTDQSPVIWAHDTFSQERPFWEEAHMHGVRHGWAIATHGRDTTTGMLSLARSEDTLLAAELADCEAKLVWLSHATHGLIGALEMKDYQLQPGQELSLREKEVLRWTGAGKTAGEIAAILGISERGITFHISNLLAKLNVVNKAQAVMHAVLLGIL